MMPLIIITVFLFGLALGAWLLGWIGRWADRRHSTVIEQMIQKSEREAFDRGYASALGVTASIDEPADHERSTR